MWRYVTFSCGPYPRRNHDSPPLFHQITSRYDGVVKAIHTKVGDIAIVGAALMDIEVAGVSAPEPVVAVEEDNDSDDIETEEKEEVRDTI
jgi:hypothetical protein